MSSVLVKYTVPDLQVGVGSRGAVDVTAITHFGGWTTKSSLSSVAFRPWCL